LQKNKVIQTPGLAFVFQALVAWVLAALILSIISALIIGRSNTGSRMLAYFSSAISFLAAAAAGVAASRSRGKGRLISGLISATVLSVLLLTLGFLINSSLLSADGVLSVVMFTYAGALAGSVFCPEKSKISRHKQGVKRKKKG